MGLLEDIMKTLERIPVWKRLATLPDEVEALNKRIAALEEKLAPATGKRCPVCDALSLKVISSSPHPEFGFAGVKQDKMRCGSCGHEETRERRPD